MEFYTSSKPRWRRQLERYKFHVISYSGLAVLLFMVWHLISDNDFSFLMTLGSVFRWFAFLILIAKVHTQRSNSGLSLKTLQAYSVVFVARLCSILFYEGYLPFDKSGDWFYQVVEVLALGSVLYLVYCAVSLYPGTYNERVDVFGNQPPVPNKAGVLWILAPTLVLAVILHPSLNGNFFTDTMWAWALYTEALAVVPQLHLFDKRGGEVDDMLANYVFALGAARLMHLVFWLSSFHELNDKYASHIGAQYPGYLVALSQIVHLLLMGKFFVLFLSSAKRGKPMRLPLPT